MTVGVGAPPLGRRVAAAHGRRETVRYPCHIRERLPRLPTEELADCVAHPLDIDLEPF
jgi:hypothetical protein